jgi:hypothetical protein
VISVVALFVALGGTGYAAGLAGSSAHDAANKPKPSEASKDLGQIKSFFDSHKSALRGATGPVGPAGLTGASGAPGAPGAPGTVVLTRVRATGPTTSATVTMNSTQQGTSCLFAPCPDSANGAVVALTANNWTQAANQINQFFGQITVTPPNSSMCTYYNGSLTNPGLMVGEIDDAATGKALAYFGGGSPSSAPSATTLPLTVISLLEPGSTVAHALIVKIADNCGAGGDGAVGGGHFTLNSFALDPVGIS